MNSAQHNLSPPLFANLYLTNISGEKNWTNCSLQMPDINSNLYNTQVITWSSENSTSALIAIFNFLAAVAAEQGTNLVILNIHSKTSICEEWLTFELETYYFEDWNQTKSNSRSPPTVHLISPSNLQFRLIFSSEGPSPVNSNSLPLLTPPNTPIYPTDPLTGIWHISSNPSNETSLRLSINWTPNTLHNLYIGYVSISPWIIGNRHFAVNLLINTIQENIILWNISHVTLYSNNNNLDWLHSAINSGELPDWIACYNSTLDTPPNIELLHDEVDLIIVFYHPHSFQ